MKKKLILDILMTIILVFIMSTLISGIQIHEIVGLILIILFFLHKVLNLKWIIAITKNIFNNKKTSKKIKFTYILDSLLLINLLGVLISGILISAYIFKLTNINIIFWSNWHHFFSIILLIIISIHIGLHLSGMINITKKILKIQGEHKTRKLVLKVFSIIFALMGLKSLTQTKSIMYLTSPFLDNDEDVVVVDKKRTLVMLNNNLVAQTTPTLTEYLGGLICTGCGRRCPLSRPQCGIGERQASVATEEYNQTYSNNTIQNDETTNQDTIDNSTTEENIIVNSSDKEDEYLGKLYCDGCGMHCPLNKLGCDRGIIFQEQALKNYKDNVQSFTIPYPLDMISIMSLFICGTHYIVTMPRKKIDNINIT